LDNIWAKTHIFSNFGFIFESSGIEDFGCPPGTVKILNPQELLSAAISTHTISPNLFLQRITSRIEVEIYFIGLQPVRLSFAQPLSDEVIEAIDTLEKILIKAFSGQ
jgi:hydrogenase maturation protease